MRRRRPSCAAVLGAGRGGRWPRSPAFPTSRRRRRPSDAGAVDVVEAGRGLPAPPRCGDGIIQLDARRAVRSGRDARTGRDLRPGARRTARWCAAGFVWDGRTTTATRSTRSRPARSTIQRPRGTARPAGPARTSSRSRARTSSRRCFEPRSAGVLLGRLRSRRRLRQRVHAARARSSRGGRPTCPGCFAHTADATRAPAGRPRRDASSRSPIPTRRGSSTRADDAGKIASSASGSRRRLVASNATAASASMWCGRSDRSDTST